jgi:hypothetical protein
MALHPILVSPIVTVVAMGVVYLDAKSRELVPRTRLLWTIGVGLISQSGFLVVFAFDNLFSRAYSLIFGRQMVVHSPYELLIFLFSTGLCISGTAVLIYGFRSRFGPLSTRIPS